MLQRMRPFLALLLGCFICSSDIAIGQQTDGLVQPVPVPAPADSTEPPERVVVPPVVQDSAIGQRIAEILETTGWFTGLDVTVRNGLVFLKGNSESDESREWAEDLAKNTEGVVAVVNQIEVTRAAVWNFDPALEVVDDLGRRFVQSLPLIVISVIVMAFAWIVARLTSSSLRRALHTRLTSNLLREVAARAAGILVILMGLYLVLRISGLTQLAFTVIGGTGLIGLAMGIAFRDIVENFLASLFLSFQKPFRAGDLIEVVGITGYVQRLTSRTTVLTTLDGNQVQVPNATIFKSTIHNFTSNPNRREDFVVGIGYPDSIPFAQEVALQVLARHPAVLDEPEPWVLVENLGPSTVNLRVYFWLDGGRHSWLKVKSSVIRLVKRAFQDAGISLPDEAREVTFPDGVPVHMVDREHSVESREPAAAKPAAAAEPEEVSTEAEAGLESEAGEIREQALRSWTPGEDLLS